MPANQDLLNRIHAAVICIKRDALASSNLQDDPWSPYVHRVAHQAGCSVREVFETFQDDFKMFPPSTSGPQP